MKQKKITIITILVVVLLILSGVVYYIFTKEDKVTTLNLLEKQWIENNKNNVIDIRVANKIPVFSYEGSGLFFDFLTALGDITSLEFNRIPYSEASETNYAIRVVKEPAENDIVIYEDNYVLATKEQKQYYNLTEIQNVRVGVLSSDLENINHYMKDANISLKTYDTIELLLAEIKKDKSEENVLEIDAIILPKMRYLKEIVEHEDLHIAYQLSEMKQSYVFTLGSTDRLNDIIRKFYKKWSSEKFDDSFAKHFTNNYFSFLGVDEKEIVKFRSKRYIYGFTDNKPYDTLSASKLVGMNHAFLKRFSDLTNVEITFEKFSNAEELYQKFNENKIDFYYNQNGEQSYLMDVESFGYSYDKRLTILSPLSRNLVINSLHSLGNVEVYTVKGSIATKHLTQNNVTVKEFGTVNELLKNMKKDTVIAMDYNTYQFYNRTMLKDYKVDYMFTIDENYQFVSRAISDNTLFNDLFAFYLTFDVSKQTINTSISNLVEGKQNNNAFYTVLVYIFAILGVASVIGNVMTWFAKRKKKKTEMTKEDKLKYIDLLTSLKNRHYFNMRMESWDESEIYPQAIVVVDLNNIAYINDNYGHAEGDKVIKEAANILIKNQMDSSEIMRTNGNEFLIYLVGYEEKEIVAYTKKLNRELKELAHSFGAATGYSMILDAIKTIDDAVNEATLDMRENKEEANGQ